MTRNPETKEYAIVMEYADLGTLHDFWDLKEFPNIPLRLQIKMASQLAQALKHVHGNNIIHRGNVVMFIFQNFGFFSRDGFNKNSLEIESPGLDCENVLVRENGSIALTGFSLAGTSLKMASRVKELGEYRNSGVTIDYDNSDIYGLGILLWEIANKKRAFEDDYDPQLLDQIMDGTRPPYNQFEDGNDAMNGLPADYIQLFTSCWNINPDLWPSIDDIVDRLDSLMYQLQDADENWERLESVWIDSTKNATQNDTKGRLNRCCCFHRSIAYVHILSSLRSRCL